MAIKLGIKSNLNHIFGFLTFFVYFEMFFYIRVQH